MLHNLQPEAVPLRAGERVENVYVSDAQIRKLPDLPTYEEIIKGTPTHPHRYIK